MQWTWKNTENVQYFQNITQGGKKIYVPTSTCCIAARWRPTMFNVYFQFKWMWSTKTQLTPIIKWHSVEDLNRGQPLSGPAGLKANQILKDQPACWSQKPENRPQHYGVAVAQSMVISVTLFWSVCQEISTEEPKQKREVMQDRSESWLLFPSLLRQSLRCFFSPWFSKPTTFPMSKLPPRWARMMNCPLSTANLIQHSLESKKVSEKHQLGKTIQLC